MCKVKSCVALIIINYVKFLGFELAQKSVWIQLSGSGTGFMLNWFLSLDSTAQSNSGSTVVLKKKKTIGCKYFKTSFSGFILNDGIGPVHKFFFFLVERKIHCTLPSHIHITRIVYLYK